MAVVAAVTLGSGTLTAVNGVAEVVEAGTGYNIVRDGVMEEMPKPTKLTVKLLKLSRKSEQSYAALTMRRKAEMYALLPGP